MSAPTTPQLTRKQRTVKTLREMADFIESHDFDEDSHFSLRNVFVFCSTPEEFSRNVKALGSCSKSAGGGYLNAAVWFDGGETKIEVTARQENVCQRVKTGTRIIPAQPERTLPATPAREEDVYEWQCPESFLRMAKEDA